MQTIDPTTGKKDKILSMNFHSSKIDGIPQVRQAEKCFSIVATVFLFKERGCNDDESS